MKYCLNKEIILGETWLPRHLLKDGIGMEYGGVIFKFGTLYDSRQVMEDLIELRHPEDAKGWYGFWNKYLISEKDLHNKQFYSQMDKILK